MPYSSWILSVIERSSRLEASDWYDSAVLGGLDALSSGITTVADITSTGAACTATQKLGLRGVIYREVGAMDKMRVAHAMRSAENDIMHWREGGRFQPHHHRHRARGRLRQPSVGVRARLRMRVQERPARGHAPRRQSRGVQLRHVRLPRCSPFTPWMIPKRGYVEIPPWMPTGVTPVRYALNWGAFESPNVLLIHAVHVDDEDIKKLREYDVSICTCARANAQLGMGVAPLGDFLRAGLNVGLGTDSRRPPSRPTCSPRCASACSSTERSTRAASSIRPPCWSSPPSAAPALWVSRTRSARSRSENAPISSPSICPPRAKHRPDPVSAVVNTCSASDVLMTMVDGKTLYEKNRWHVDVEVAKNIARVIEIRAKLRV